MEHAPVVDSSQELMLEQFRLVRATLDTHGQKLDELLFRVSTLEIGLAGMRRGRAGDAETVAHLQARVDRIQNQIERINQRLELTDGPV